MEFPLSFPILQTGRLLLREITLDDALELFTNYSDPDVANWFSDEPYTQIEQADLVIRVFIEKSQHGKGFTWAIVLRATGEFLGTCSIEDVEAGSRGEIGFDLAKEHWGKGYMVEAAGVIIAYGFKELKQSKIEAETYSHNSRARRVLEKLGFRVEEVREASHFYTLSAEDWLKKRS